MSEESFFDELIENTLDKFSLWNKISKEEASGPSSDEIVHQGWLCRPDSSSGSLLQRFFVVTNNRIYYKKNQTDPTFKGYLSLGFVRMICPTAEELEGNDVTKKLKISFIHNLKISNLFARSLEELETWLIALTPRVVRTDFRGRFNVRAFVGQGAFAKVYLASDPSGNDFAVKVFDKHTLLEQPGSRSNLINEVNILRGLDNPNIMKLYEIHEDENSIYLVCEFLSGGTLREFLQSSTELLSDKTVLSIILGLLNAVAYMSMNRIVHKDLKPENVILKKTKRVGPADIKVIDYGLSARIDSENLYKRSGTPGYVSPELILSEEGESKYKINSKADVFAVGVIAYLLFTGGSLFECGNARQTLKRTAQCNVDFNHPLLQNKSPAIINLLRGMLVRNPNQRFSASEALKSEAFEEFTYKLRCFDKCVEEGDIPAMDENCGLSETIHNLENQYLPKFRENFNSGTDSIKIDNCEATRTSDVKVSESPINNSPCQIMASNKHASNNIIKLESSTVNDESIVNALHRTNLGFASHQ